MAKEKFDASPLANSLKDGFSLGDAGVVTPSDDLLERFLKESGSEQTVDTIKQSQQVIANFVDTATLAFGRASIDFFKGDKKLEATETKIKVGNDKLRINMTRESEVGVGEHRSTKHGQTKVQYLVSGGSNVGSMKKIRALLNEEAASALAK